MRFPNLQQCWAEKVTKKIKINAARTPGIRRNRHPSRRITAATKVYVHHTLHFTKQSVERDVIVAHGTAKDLNRNTPVQIYSEQSKVRRGGSGSGTLQDFLGLIGEKLNTYVVNEAKTATTEPPVSAGFRWEYYPDSDYSKMGNRREELTNLVLKYIAGQTGLTFTRERRFVDVWFVTEEK
jgi:hypothetical protein